MKLYPEYSLNIIVYLIANKIGQWYVTEKEIWFLNRIKFAKAFDIEPTVEQRHFSESIAAGNPLCLMNEINEYRVEKQELEELISIYPSPDVEEDLLEMYPSLYINFEQKILLNLFPEPSGQFEKFAPEGWFSAYEDFLNKIPNKEIYWRPNGRSVFD